MSSPLDTLLESALAAHRAGSLTEAQAGYEALLARRPDDATARYLLGLVCFHRGHLTSAVQHITRSLQLAPANVRAWKDLGGVLMAAERLEEARDAYASALAADPTHAQSWYNLGICLYRSGDIEGGIGKLRQAISRDPGYLRAYEPLATLLYQHGDTEAAAEVYRQWVRRDPADPKARHMAAAATGEDVPARASDEYIRTHFDGAAGSFDTNLEQLEYRAPQLVAAALARWSAKGPLPALLDAGCGTGLAGPLVRAHCRSLIGIDLSPGMLAQAGRRGCYDQLLEAELTSYLRSHPHAFDAVICVDTLVYFGELEEPLNAARVSLTEAGLLIFTLEASSGAEHQLHIHGRYTHGEAYLQRILPAAGLKALSITRETLRQERQAQVQGHLVIARRN